MEHYFSVHDIDQVQDWIREAAQLKLDPLANHGMGNGKTLGLIFFNNSLRTRMSTQKAAFNLGMNVMVMNIGAEGWVLDFEEGSIMNRNSAEHIREAAQVVCQYCDIVGIRAFATLEDKERDEAELVLKGFIKYSSVPVINLESSVHHPLQALADALTIAEHKKTERPKVVLSWAPHPRALPQAVANSFVQIMQKMPVDLVVTHPDGYALHPGIVNGVTVEYEQKKALEDADFVYVKNWSSYTDYGKVLSQDRSWMMTAAKLGGAQFMHCLPVRRNVIVEDAVLDGPQSLVLQQANNRTFAAQLVLKKLLEKE